MTPTRARATLAEAAVHALLAGDVLALQPMVSPDVVDHAAEPGQPEGWRGLRERVMTLCAALPDGDVTVDVLRMEGDTVLARAVITAVRRVAGPEPVEVARPLTVAVVLRFDEEGLLSELWTSSDLAVEVPREQESRVRAVDRDGQRESPTKGGEAPMSVRTDVARQALKALAAGELPLMESFFADTFVFHTQRDGKPADRTGLPDRALLLTSTLHEATLSIEIVLEDGDLVALRWRGRAVHRGNLLGVPATGARVETTGITIFRFAGDLIAEEWTEFDGLGLLGQIAPGRRPQSA